MGAPQQLAGRVLLDDRVRPEQGRRGHYLSVTGTWRIHPVIRDLALHSPLPEIVSVLTQSEKVCLYDYQLPSSRPARWKKLRGIRTWGITTSRARKYAASGYRPIGKRRTWGSWNIYEGRTNGGKIFKVNYFISDATSSDDGGEEIPKIDGHEADFDLVCFAPEPGDVVVHHLRTLHGAGGNRSLTSTRRGVTFHMR